MKCLGKGNKKKMVRSWHRNDCLSGDDFNSQTFEHCWHLCKLIIGFFECLRLMCCFSMSLCTNPFSQNVHWWGFSPVCIIECLFRISFCTNAFPHSSHRNGFSPEIVQIAKPQQKLVSALKFHSSFQITGMNANVTQQGAPARKPFRTEITALSTLLFVHIFLQPLFILHIVAVLLNANVKRLLRIVAGRYSDFRRFAILLKYFAFDAVPIGHYTRTSGNGILWYGRTEHSVNKFDCNTGCIKGVYLHE